MYDPHNIIEVIETLAHSKGEALPPNWAHELDKTELDGTYTDIARVCIATNLPVPVPQKLKPRPDQFPLIAFDPAVGWGVAEQWENEDEIRLSGLGHSLWRYHEELLFFDIDFPDPLRSDLTPNALSTIARAVFRRKQVLISAGIATVVVNILALVTSLYSMQLFDRVIPLASYSTLFVLTIGVLIAQVIDFALRTIRSIMIERESAEIDAEVSEYFFARTQAIRLDARPPGVGTMAAQLRGLEQIRGVLSSGSLFLLADLPFALLFIAFIAMIGGPVAWVPVLSLPIALACAFVLARLIRTGADKAQVSGNRKNGLLVESIDSSETVKANRGGWYMLGKWNRLVREVHHHEDPVKRTSAVAQSTFGALQQAAYVAIMAVGAFEVGSGRISTGALLACSIIAGRVNGPLVAQLPNFIVQWSYARSSLRALDSILALPIERATGEASLRPESIANHIQLNGIRFSYPGAREHVEVAQLDLMAGERIAIIGGVGSGKTTLLRIAAGLFNPLTGSVKLGGLDMGQIAEDVLRRNIGYLPQDFRLVNGTLRDNLLMGLPGISDDVLVETAKATGLAEIIASHPHGLDRQIQEGGRGLSGGQRSLVGLTRLFLLNPKIWLLDEPTANLDTNAEARIMRLLGEKLTPEQTVVIVTHRIQVLPNFSRTILMSSGRVALDGPTASVIQRMQRGPAAESRTVSSPIATVTK